MFSDDSAGLERSLIGQIIDSPSDIAIVLDRVKPEDFSLRENEAMWRAMVALHEAQKPISPELVYQGARAEGGRLLPITSIISMLREVACGIEAIEAVADEIAVHARVRLGLGKMSEILAESRELTAGEILARFKEFREFLDSGIDHAPKDITAAEASQQVLDKLEACYRGEPSDDVGLRTGIAALDRRIGLIEPTDLVVVAAFPGDGKTALATTIAVKTAKDGKDVLLFSLEMGPKESARRIMAAEAAIEQREIKRGLYSPMGAENLQAVSLAVKNIKAWPGKIVYGQSITMSGIRSTAHRHARSGNLGLIVVDYLQLVTNTQASGRANRSEIVASIARESKNLTIELGIPIILVSQFHRMQGDKSPTMFDLRESGEIENAANTILIIDKAEDLQRCLSCGTYSDEPCDCPRPNMVPIEERLTSMARAIRIEKARSERHGVRAFVAFYDHVLTYGDLPG